MSKPSAATKAYCFQHDGNILFLQHIVNHPVNLKNLQFEYGKISILATNNKIYSCTVRSNQLNPNCEWDQQFFSKLLFGFGKFQLERSTQEEDQTLHLVIRDHFIQHQVINLIRTKIVEEFATDALSQFWTIFSKYNQEKSRSLLDLKDQHRKLQEEEQSQLIHLKEMQENKQKQIEIVKGQLSALLMEKVKKLKEYDIVFEYGAKEQQGDRERQDEISEHMDVVPGSLFQSSQDFMYN